MRKAESIFSMVIAILCLVYLFFIWQMDDFGAVTEPGAAFFPAVLGVVGLVVSLSVWMTSRKEKKDSQKGSVSKEGLKRFWSYVVASLIFIPVFETLGAYVAIFALVLVLSKILGGKGWVQPVGLAAVSAIIAYLLFFIVLEVPLPRGIF